MAQNILAVKFKVSKLDIFFIKAGVVCRMAMRQSEEQILAWVEIKAADIIKYDGPVICKR